MSLLFRYKAARARRPAFPLGGRLTRPRPVLAVTLLGPGGVCPIDALLDTGADDTVFPDRLATAAGVDLSNAPVGEASGIGTGAAQLRYARVTLRLASSRERREWQAWVGFTSTPLKYPLLGFAGFLQYFTATFHGDREEVELTVNGLYPGT